MNNPNSQENGDVDKNRRRFLAVMLIGSGTFLVEKVMGPLFSRFLNNHNNRSQSPKVVSSDKADFNNFKIAESNNSLSVYDSSGEEVLQIDKEA